MKTFESPKGLTQEELDAMEVAAEKAGSYNQAERWRRGSTNRDIKVKPSELWSSSDESVTEEQVESLRKIIDLELDAARLNESAKFVAKKDALSMRDQEISARTEAKRLLRPIISSKVLLLAGFNPVLPAEVTESELNIKEASIYRSYTGPDSDKYVKVLDEKIKQAL